MAEGATSIREKLANSVGLEVNFAHFRRLLLDELIGAASPQARSAAAEISRQGVAAYRQLLLPGSDATDAPMLFIAVIALSCYAPSARAIYEAATGQKISQQTMTDRYRDFIAQLLARGVGAEPEAVHVPPATPRRGRPPKAG